MMLRISGGTARRLDLGPCSMLVRVCDIRFVGMDGAVSRRDAADIFEELERVSGWLYVWQGAEIESTLDAESQQEANQ